jgi:hypothetical protein
VAPALISVVCRPKVRAADTRAASLRGNRFDGSEAAAEEKSAQEPGQCESHEEHWDRG